MGDDTNTNTNTPNTVTPEQPTPETDAAEVKVTEQDIWMNTSFVPSNIARKLEVERNEALDQLASETDRSRELWDFNQKILNEIFDLQVKLINLQDPPQTKDDEHSL